MNAYRSTRRTRKTAIVALGAITILALAVTPAVADPGPMVGGDYGVATIAEPAVIEQLIDIDWDAVNASLDEQPEITDGGFDEQATPPQVPEGGEDEPGDTPQVPEGGQDTPSEQTDVPEGGDDEPGNEPEVPEGGDDEPGDEPEQPEEPPSLPFTGGDAGRFAVAGIFVLMAGMLVLARGYALRRS